jgi:VCBS repeat-containing protein
MHLFGHWLSILSIVVSGAITMAAPSFANEAPQLTGLDNLSASENAINAAPVLLDGDVSVADAEGNWNGGHVQISGLLNEDTLSIRHTGTGSGQVAVSGSSVSFEGGAVGTVSGGNGATFRVDFNANATNESIEAVIEAIEYSNASNTPTQSRELVFRLVDGAGAAAFGQVGSPVEFAARTGSGNPFDGAIPAIPGRSDNTLRFTPAFADLDGDGDNDLVGGTHVSGTAYGNGYLLQFRNIGDRWSPDFVYADGQFLGHGIFEDDGAPEFGDVDGDGDFDLLIGTAAGAIRYFENTGNATSASFTERTGAANPFDAVSVAALAGPSLADVDGDNDLDLHVGYSDPGVAIHGLAYYENTGSVLAPAFTARTGGVPASGVGQTQCTGSDYIRPSFADFDVDGDLDLHSCNEGAKWASNRGTASAPDIGLWGNAPTPSSVHHIAAFADLDGDGDPDMFASSHLGIENYQYLENTAVDFPSITVTVTAEADAPVALNDTFNAERLSADQGHRLHLVANDSDPDGDALTITQINDQAIEAPAGNGVSAPAASSITLPSGAVVALTDGAVNYDPTNAAFAVALADSVTADDAFTYTISDGTLTDTANVTVTVTGVNDTPVADDDALSVLQGDGVADMTALLLAGDIDPDTGETAQLVITSIDTLGLAGAATLNAGSVTYGPNGQFTQLAAGETATDSLTYTITDPHGATSMATVTVSITGTNDTPVARDDGLATTNMASLNANLFADNGSGIDSDVDTGDSFEVSAVNGVPGNVDSQITLTSGALLTVNANGAVNYDPNGAFALAPGATDTDNFTYTIADGIGATASATVTINLTGNRAPVAQNDDYRTHPADGFEAGDNQAFDSLNQDAVAIGNNRFARFRYGEGRFFYEVIDEANQPVSAEVELPFSPRRENLNWGVFPLQDNEVYLVLVSNQEGDRLGPGDRLPSEISLAIVDIDANTSSSEFTVRSYFWSDRGGSLGNLQFAPINGGRIAIQSSRSTSTSISDLHVDVVNRLAVEQVVSEPCLNRNFCQGTLLSNRTNVVSVLNDEAGIFKSHYVVFGFNEGFEPFRTQFEWPTFMECQTRGTRSVLDLSDRPVNYLGANCVRFPTGELPEEYSACADGCWARLSDGLFQIVTENAPIPANESLLLDVLQNDSDPDGDALTLASVHAAALGDQLAGVASETTGNGAAISISNNQVRYDPSGAAFARALAQDQTTEDRFFYTVSDGQLTDEAEVTVVMTGVNDPPTLAPISTTINEDGPNTNLSGLVFGAALSDPDNGDTHVVTSVNRTGTVGTVVNSDELVRYDPNGQFESLALGANAQDQFGVTIADAAGATASATVTVTIEGANDAPSAVNDAFNIAEEAAGVDVTSTLISNDSDIDSGETAQLAITAIDSSLTRGRVELVNGVVTYDPNGFFNALAAGQTDTDSFRYTISDPHGATASATANITINGFNGYPLNITTNGLGAGAVTSLPLGINCGGGGGCVALFTQNTEVALTANVGAGVVFEGWSGDCLDNSATLCAVRMNGERNVSARFALANPPEGRIVAATLPGARSGFVGGPPITVFMSVLSRQTTPAQACRVTAPGTPPFTLSYQQVDAGGNPIGAADPLFDLGEGGAINFVIALQPNTTTQNEGYVFLPQIACENANLTPIEGVNSVLVSIGPAPIPDILSIGQTPSADGVVRIPVNGIRISFLSAAALNIGAGDASAGAGQATVTASVDTGTTMLPLTLEVCETLSTGGCITPRGETSTTSVYDPNVVKFYAVFVRANEGEFVPFSPANARVFLRFADATGAIRSVTSAAVSAPAPAGLEAVMSMEGSWSVLVRQADGIWPPLRRGRLILDEFGRGELHLGEEVYPVQGGMLPYSPSSDVQAISLEGLTGYLTDDGRITVSDPDLPIESAMWGIREHVVDGHTLH